MRVSQGRLRGLLHPQEFSDHSVSLEEYAACGLHNRPKMTRLIGSIEWLYNEHPYQPNTEIDNCQNKPGLAYKTPYHEQSQVTQSRRRSWNRRPQCSQSSDYQS